MIKRYVHGIFSAKYKATIGVDFALKVIKWSNDTNIRLQLWDIAGQERFGSMTRGYYKEALGAIILFDIGRSNTLESVKKWKADIDSKVLLPKSCEPIPVILLGNKIDILEDSPNAQDDDYGPYGGKTDEGMDKFCEDNGFVSWYGISSRDDVNINAAINDLIENILINVPEENYHEPEKNTVEIIDKKNEQNSGCC
jgi:Ras-related protein Rab-32